MNIPSSMVPPRTGALLLTFLATVSSGCADEATWPEAGESPAPESRGDGWAVGSPESQGFDPRVITLLDHDLRTRRIEEIDALLIARRGVLVYEGYFDPATAVDARHQLNSATKSVASMVVGVAAQQGLVGSYEQSIAELFPEAADLFEAEPGKRDITLRHVLTMKAGLDWDHKAVEDRDRDDLHIKTAPDAVRYVLEKPLVDEPGARFYYNSGCSMLLTGLIPNVSGLEADAFAEMYLFEPLGIEDVFWQTTDDGTARGQDGLHMRGRDLLKLGQLYLQGGEWNGQQIVSPEWIEASFRPWTETDWSTSRYGFQWWMYRYSPSGSASHPYGLITASGYGGQKLFIVPELDLVAVFFGCTTEGYDCGISDTVPEAVMYNYVLRAVDSG
ncbi:MAG: serine hydrolase domain-containing protein [Longimicrobiales bacterium]